MKHDAERAEYPATERAPELVAWALERFHPAVALACSFSLEDVALAHMLVAVRPDARVFALDTGRLNEETRECAEALRRRLGIRIEWFFPRHAAVEPLERDQGLFSFRDSLAARQQCCRIRKVEPLERALHGLRALITGLRREQAVTRAALPAIETDAVHGGIVKINPLAAWTLAQVWQYVRAHQLPYNRLYDQGYGSIGCAPCTRAVAPDADQRAGRWWWEQPEHKECGLHVRHAPPGTEPRR